MGEVLCNCHDQMTVEKIEVSRDSLLEHPGWRLILVGRLILVVIGVGRGMLERCDVRPNSNWFASFLLRNLC